MSTSLREILGPLSIDDFKQTYWGKKAWLRSKALPDPAEFGDKEQFEAESTKQNCDRRWQPRVSLNLDESVLESVSIHEAMKLRASGWGMTLHEANRVNEKVLEFIMGIENQLDALSEEFQADYYQPGPGRGMKQDCKEELFILQLEGSSQWSIGKNTGKNSEVRPKGGAQSFSLSKGSFLYIPAGRRHTFKSGKDYALFLIIKRRALGVFDAIDKLVEFNDPHQHHLMRNGLSLPSELSDMKAMVLDRLDATISYLENQGPEFYRKLGWYASTPEFRRPKAPPRVVQSGAQELELDALLERNPSARFKIVEFTSDGEKILELFIEGQPIEFQEAKWMKFAYFLTSAENFTPAEAIRACGAKVGKDWTDLKAFLTELLSLGYIRRSALRKHSLKKVV